MILQLVVFWYWSNIVIFNIPRPGEENGNSFLLQHDICRIILFLTAFYLISIEVTALLKEHWRYFMSPTRLLNIITPTLLLWNVFSSSRL